MAWISAFSILEPRVATDEELRAFHTPAYVDFVRERSASGQGLLDGGDTPAFRGVYEAAACVVGATLNAADAIMQGECRRAFVPIAGLHHAARDRAAGFCVFNDCGVAIELLRKKSGLERVAYVDIDAHHGDGVFYAFEDDAAVIFADMHEDGRYLYPGTGAADETGRGAAQGTKLNLPMAPGSDDAAFARVWPQVIAHLERFAPEFIILQCGADSVEGDPITHLRFSVEDARLRGARVDGARRAPRSRARAGARWGRLQPRQYRAGLDRGGRKPALTRMRRPGVSSDAPNWGFSCSEARPTARAGFRYNPQPPFRTAN